MDTAEPFPMRVQVTGHQHVEIDSKIAEATRSHGILL